MSWDGEEERQAWMAKGFYSANGGNSSIIN